MRVTEELKEQYLEMIIELSNKEKIDSIFIYECVYRLVKELPFDDFMSGYYNAVCTKERYDWGTGLLSPNPATVEMSKMLLMDADEISLSSFFEADKNMMQLQAEKDMQKNIKQYHIAAFNHVSGQLMMMLEKYKADSVGEIVAHLYKELKPIVELHKRAYEQSK